MENAVVIAEEQSVKVPVAVVQTPVTWDVERNVASIDALLADAQPGEVLVFPEAVVSGYDDDLSRLGQLDPDALGQGIDRLAALARQKNVHLFCGSLMPHQGGWCNAAIYLSPGSTRWTYQKVNLATHERGRLKAGAALPTLPLHVNGSALVVGVQICREILFPEQWQYLAEAGAQVFVYLTYAANRDVPAGVWRSHLISHAAANQRFVIAANVADPDQHCPSMIISPRGEVFGELPAGKTAVLRAVIDTEDVSDWYLGQRRTDVLRLQYTNSAASSPNKRPISSAPSVP
jgi:predicted amidohydrolase